MHLHRKLKALTNLSSSEFIRNIRLEEAIILLKKKEMSITEAAYATGFSSPAYFSTSFTKYFGLSPKEYWLQQ
jgi:AraC-like DNA-binding protein